MSVKHKLGILFAALFAIALFAVPLTRLYLTRDNSVIDYESQEASLAAAKAEYEAAKASNDAASLAEAIENTPPITIQEKKDPVSSVTAGTSEASSSLPSGQDTGTASKPEPPPPPEIPEEQASNPESVPEYTPEQIKPNEPSVSSTAPEASKPSTPKTTTPKDGDTKTENGKNYIYIGGFGWIENHGGGGSGTVAEGMQENGNKIGQMG